jgi:hypothetical protein
VSKEHAYWISGYQSSDYNGYLLSAGHNGMLSGRSSSTFRRNILPPFAGLKTKTGLSHQEVGGKQISGSSMISETSVVSYRTIRRYVPQDIIIQGVHVFISSVLLFCGHLNS